MADWEHKERRWARNVYSDLHGDLMQQENLGHPYPVFPRSFTEWLDWQCKDGWEVIKISRNFIELDRTWCVFRRKK